MPSWQNGVIYDPQEDAFHRYSGSHRQHKKNNCEIQETSAVVCKERNRRISHKHRDKSDLLPSEQRSAREHHDAPFMDKQNEGIKDLSGREIPYGMGEVSRCKSWGRKADHSRIRRRLVLCTLNIRISKIHGQGNDIIDLEKYLYEEMKMEKKRS